MRPLQAFKSRIPLPLRFLAARLLPLRSRRRSRNVSQLRSHRIGANVILDVYWLASGAEQGPATSVYVYDDEVLRIDCFDGAGAHLHVNRKQSRAIPDGGGARLYFPPAPIAGHIERACFELETNLRYCLALNVSRRIRSTRLDGPALGEAVAFLRREMQALVRAHASGAAASARPQAVGEAAQEAPAAVQRAG